MAYCYQDFPRRRTLVQAILSPPSVSISLMVPGGGKPKKVTTTCESNRGARDLRPRVTLCCLCHEVGPWSSSPFLGKVMREIGLDFGRNKESATCCHFCLTQLQNLVRLRAAMDRQKQRLVTMVNGLRSLLVMNTSPRPQDKEDRRLVGRRVFKDDQLSESDLSSDDGETRSDDDDDSDYSDDSSHTLKNSETALGNYVTGGHAKVFTCNMCFKTFKSSRTLLTHQELYVHFQCTLCPSHYSSRSELRSHAQIHISEVAADLICGEDPGPFTREKALRMSARRKVAKNHVSPTEKSIRCPHCPQRFYKQSGLDRHSISHVPSAERPFRCDLCSMHFCKRGSLTRHHGRAHYKVPDCSLCPMIFPTKKELNTHMTLTHQTSKAIWTCVPCNSAFRDNDSLQKHQEEIHSYHPSDTSEDSIAGTLAPQPDNEDFKVLIVGEVDLSDDNV